jgi:hypothetical protein
MQCLFCSAQFLTAGFHDDQVIPRRLPANEQRQ